MKRYGVSQRRAQPALRQTITRAKKVRNFTDGVTLFSSKLGVAVQEPVGIDLSSAPEQGFRMTIKVDGTTDCDEDQVAAWIDATLTP
jgi:hypothetical protein